jgi:hypothetical protein
MNEGLYGVESGPRCTVKQVNQETRLSQEIEQQTSSKEKNTNNNKIRKDKNHDEENLVDGKFAGFSTDCNAALVFGIATRESE